MRAGVDVACDFGFKVERKSKALIDLTLLLL